LNVPRSNIAPRFLVARKLPHRRDQDFKIDARLDQRTELPLGRFARVRSITWRIGLPKFLEFFARIRAARVSDRPREILILDSGLWILSFILLDIGGVNPPVDTIEQIWITAAFSVLSIFVELCLIPDHAPRVDDNSLGLAVNAGKLEFGETSFAFAIGNSGERCELFAGGRRPLTRR